MANPAPTINQINAFNATQGTTIDFNIIGGTDLVRSNIIYIYDLSDNSLICTHLYVSTESIHELPPNTDASVVYESGKSSADFVNGAQYYAQIQTFTDIGGTEGGSGLSVAKMFWCLVDPTLTIDTIPSTISTTSYNVSATYNANTSVVSNIIQQYQFSLYSATGSLLQSSGVVVGSGTQQGTSTTYDISYNFSGLSVGSSYYVVVDVTTTQGMSVSAQSGTFTVSIDTPTLGEATVVNNACDGYISVTSNLSGEYGGSGSGEIVSFETDSENVFTKLQVDLEPVQDLHGYDKPWVGGAGVNKFDASATTNLRDFSRNGETFTNTNTDTRSSVVFNVVYLSNGSVISVSNSISITATGRHSLVINVPSNADALRIRDSGSNRDLYFEYPFSGSGYYTISADFTSVNPTVAGGLVITNIQLETGSTATSYAPYSNICPISGHDEVEVDVVGKNLFNKNNFRSLNNAYIDGNSNKIVYGTGRIIVYIPCFPNTTYTAQKKRLETNTRFYIGYTNSVPDIGSSVVENHATNSGTIGEIASCSITTDENAKYLIVWATWTPSIWEDELPTIQIEYGNTPTTYEPYTETTVSEQFDVSLTPTSKDTDPYLFKATGDIYGDRLEEELVGGSVVWNQLVQNGNFASATGWYKAASTTLEVANNVAKVTQTAQYQGITTVLSSNPLASGHKYLIVADVKADSERSLDFVLGDNTYFTLTGAISVTTGWATYGKIVNVTSANIAKNNQITGIRDSHASGFVSYYVKNFNCTDLTAFFGNATIADAIYAMEQAQAGSGIALLKASGFFNGYMPYDTGTLKSVTPTAHVTRGVNAWDEEYRLGFITAAGVWVDSLSGYFSSKNPIQVLPNTEYNVTILSGGNNSVYYSYYDASGVFINRQTLNLSSGKRIITTPSNAHYMNFSTEAFYGTTYKNDICINISDPTINGKYFPYEEHTYAIAPKTLRGKPSLVNGELVYSGDKLEYNKHTEAWSEVDLGSYTWSYIQPDSSYPYGYFWTTIVGKANGLTNMVSEHSPVYSNMGGLTKGTSGNASNSRIYIVDSAYSDPTTFKTAMNGVKLAYEKATPTVTTGEYFTEIQEVSKYGTLEYITSNDVPVGHNTTYLTRDVFGGTLDLVSGRLVVTWGIVDLGTINWTYYSDASGYAFFYNTYIPSGTKADGINNLLSDRYPIGETRWTLTEDKICGGNINSQLIWVRDTSYTDATTFKTAMNGAQLAYELATPLTYQLTPQQINTLVGTNNVWSEQGDVELAYHIPITNLLVKRQDVDDVSGNWLTLYSQPITQASDMDFTFIDFLNQYGKTYKYALVPLLTQTQSGVEVEVEGGYTVSDEVQSIFDGVFISDSTGSQKCKANVGYGNVNMNQSVGSITPIGSQYPIIVTNSNNRYHNGSISGMIVPDDYYYNGNLSRIDMVNKRNELEQFLTNKRAKIIKDWNSNIWLVMIMDNIDCSFDNNYGMGIVTFNANWLEVGDPTNQEDLQATGLVNVGGV